MCATVIVITFTLNVKLIIRNFLLKEHPLHPDDKRGLTLVLYTFPCLEELSMEEKSSFDYWWKVEQSRLISGRLF